MARMSINEMTTFRWSFDEDVHHYAQAGVEAIGVWRSKLSDFGEERGIELLRDCNLAVSCLSWAGGFTGGDGRSYRESVDDAREAIELAGALGAESLIVYSGPRGGHTHNHARRLFRTALTELAPAAAECNVKLAVEPLHPGCGCDWTFLHSLDETLALIAAVDSPQLKLVLDVYHWCHDESVVARLGELAPHLAIVQLGDAHGPPQGEQNRMLLGRGSLPLRQVVRSLLDAGYDGYFDIELIGEEIEMIENCEIVAHSQQAFAELISPTVQS